MTPLELNHAIEAVELCLDFSRPADVQLSGFFRNYPKLGGRERGLIAESVYGVLRHLRTLEFLAQGSGKETRGETTRRATPRRLVLAWLARFGGYNLRELEPLVSKSDLDWLRGLKAADLGSLSPAEALDLPDWLYPRLLEQYGNDLPTLMAALNQTAPLDIRINPAKTTREAALDKLVADGFEAQATPFSPLGIRLKGKPALQKHPLFLDGSLEVQDEGSQLLGQLLAPRRGEMVCDFCAGAGGKTLLLGALMRSAGRLYAFDISEKRLARMKPRLARSGLSNVQAQVLSGERDAKLKRLVGKFDRVLVDAPCSGLGTLRRNPDLKWRQSATSVHELTAKQSAILESASRLVKTGGRLVYATCSLLTEENEAIVEGFLAAHPDFHLLHATEVLAGQRIEISGSEAHTAADATAHTDSVRASTHPFLRLDPAKHATDGFFAAVLERI